VGSIHVLDGHIANQIAAGEVVERPSSVVKELVENAIDAEATRIDVWIEDGGLQLIRVSDNGRGMDADDCRLAFSRHATSKIATGKDLFQIRTLGFRGEALPSIAAVAKVSCTSAREDGRVGSRLRIEGGNFTEFEDVSAPRGTDILVKDLFFNTPARLKYMKTVQTEMSHISDYLYRLSMAYPNIAFTLRHHGNSLLQTTGRGDLLQVIASVYGNAAAKQMVKIDAENPDYTLSGWVSKPELNRSNRQAVTFIINGRFVRNFGLAQAVQQAFHTLLPIHRFPLAVIHLRMDPTLLDVNVHPAKLEVRFSKEQELFRFVETAVRHVLNRQILIPEAQKQVTPLVREHVIQERIDFAPAVAPQNDTFVRETATETGNAYKGYREAAASHQPSSVRSVDRSSIRPEKLPDHAVDWMEPPQTKPEIPKFPKLYPIGQLHGTYIIAQNENGLYLLDQHAAHERINYERYYELFGQPSDASQSLIVPITLEFTSAEAAILEERLPIFAQAGVVLEHFGGQSFIVRAYPHWFPSGEEQRIITEMADWILAEKQSVDISKLREKSAIMCACKSSIRANEHLSQAEMEALIDRLSRCRSPFTCPHGRPITVSFTTYELEKMFKRVM